MADWWTLFEADVASIYSYTIARRTGEAGLFALNWLDDMLRYRATHTVFTELGAQLYCEQHPVGRAFPFSDPRLYPAIIHGFDDLFACYPQVARWIVRDEQADRVMYRIVYGA